MSRTDGGLRRRKQQANRERLLESALRVIGERGLDGATVPAIAEEADLSTGAVYSNFSGKEELYLASIMHLVQRGVRRRAMLRDQVTGARDALARMLDDWTSSIDEDPESILLLVEFWLYAMRRRLYRPLVSRVMGGIRDDFRDNLQAHGGPVDDDTARQLATALQALAYGHAMQQLSDPDEIGHADLQRAVVWLLAGAGIALPEEEP